MYINVWIKKDIKILKRTYVARSFHRVRIVRANLCVIDVISHAVVYIGTVFLVSNENVDSL